VAAPAELFHAIADAASAEARRRAAALGLLGRLDLRNVHYPSHRAALAARGGGAGPALWDGERLHQGLDAVVAARPAMAARP
jgi:hypothetical protein